MFMRKIILSTEGQTCNKFWAWSRYFSDALANNEKIFILSPDITLEDYPNLIKTSFLKYPFYKKGLVKLFGYKRYIKILKALLENKFTIRVFKTVIPVITNFEYHHVSVAGKRNKNKELYYDTLINIFSPSEEIKDYCISKMNQVKVNFNLVIGLHIRYGDYRTYKEGKYYYDLEQYRQKVEELKVELGENQSVALFVASNEKIDLSIFEGLDAFYLQRGGATHDLFMLSQCDYILGPPSTYSAWASYYGDKPIYFIEDIEEQVSVSAFENILEFWDG